MKKPKLKHKSYLDYHECEEFINKKYKINIDDFDRKFDNDIHKRAMDVGNLIDPSGEWAKISPRDATGIQKLACEESAKIHSEMDKIDFKCFWHWILDAKGIENGDSFCISEDDLDELTDKQEWIKTIIGYFLEEFGTGEPKEAEFEVSW